MWLILQLDYCRKGLKFCHIQRLQKSRSLAICCSYHVSCLCVCLRKCLHLCVAFSINCLVSICILMYGNKLKQWRKGNGFFFFLGLVYVIYLPPPYLLLPTWEKLHRVWSHGIDLLLSIFGIERGRRDLVCEIFWLGTRQFWDFLTVMM